MIRHRIPMNGKIKHAFTLIEIMLALLVVSVGIVAMIGLLSSTLDSSSKAHNDLNIVSFSDMVFNYCHSVTNWSSIPTTGTLTIPDYTFVDTPIQINQLAQFECRVPNFGNNERSTYTVSYILNVTDAGTTKELSLRVWPGFSTNGYPRIFYTEFYNWVDK